MTHHLAQVNIARMRAPLADPLMAGFVAQLEEINALADGSPGFVWRLQSAEGDATSFRPYDDDSILINLSLWASVADLHAFTYSGRHRAVMADRRQWFTRMDQLYVALWWVPAGAVPTPQEARRRLEHLQTHGPTPHAFSFARPFSPPDCAAKPLPAGGLRQGAS